MNVLIRRLGLEDYAEGETDEEEPDTTEEAVREEVAEKEEDANRKKTVRWSEELDAVKPFRKNDLVMKPELAEAKDETLKITFSHSEMEEERKSARFADADLDRSPIVSSPADIFSKFSNSGGCVEFARGLDEPKSILKVKKSTTPVLTDRLQRFEGTDAGGPDGPESKQQQQQHEQGDVARPIADEVVEKEPTSAPDAPLNTHRPLSRFKAARQHKKL